MKTLKPHIDGKKWKVWDKRAQNWVQRPNKVAVHYQRKSKIGGNGDLLSLAVRGTCDVLARRSGILALSKTTAKQHPTDRGYFKIVYVLSSHGRTLLNRKIKEHSNGIQN